MNNLHYILDAAHNIVAVDLMAWAKWFEDERFGLKRVAETTVVVEATGEEFWVSTVFLGIDHRFGEGPPLLFETMVFDNSKIERGELGGYQDLAMDRYSTWDEALAGHQAMVERVKRGEISKGEE